MVESSIKPKRRRGSITLTDRMSSLPDSFLCHILSFLPTRTSVNTMTLVSCRWPHVWKHLQVFYFNHFGRSSLKKFALFVNAMLSLRRSRTIQKFHLHCNISDDDDNFKGDSVDMWILAAIGPHLQQTDLIVMNCFGCRPVHLPPSFFMNCTNLVSLRLFGEIKVEVKHSSVHFPSLKILEIAIFAVDSVVSFLSGCPILETIDIYFDFKDISLTKVSLPPSTHHNFTWSYFKIGPNHNGITLGILGNFHSMVGAFIDVFSSCTSKFVDPIILNLIRDSVDYLHLRLHHSTSKKQLQLHSPVPKFHTLRHLKFILPCFNSNLVVKVLEKCHMLQVLIIQYNKEEPSPSWQPLESTTVSECLKSHLTYIHIEGYQGFDDELAFAEYILRNGLVLETMLIFVSSSMDLTNKYCSVKRLLNIPRGSDMCTLKFDPDVS